MRSKRKWRTSARGTSSMGIWRITVSKSWSKMEYALHGRVFLTCDVRVFLTCDDWLGRRQSFFSSRYLKSDPILGYCLPLTMHTEDKTEKVRISLNARTAVPSYLNFTERNQAENQHWGQRCCGNDNSACAQGLQVFLILSIIARSQHLKSKSLPFLVICHDEIVVAEMEVLCCSFLIKS